MLNKKALGPIVMVSLLLIVIVVATIGVQNWYSTFQSDFTSDVEIKLNNGKTSIKIISLVGDVLYIKNEGSKNISINSIKIENKDCNVSSSYSIGISNISLGNNCSQNLSSVISEIVISTNNGIFSKELEYRNNTI